MNKTYLIYLDSVFMEEASKLKQAIEEAKNYINTQQGKLAEVWSIDTDTHKDQAIYRVADNSHIDDYSVEVSV